MTGQERFVQAYEDLVRAQAVAGERLAVLLVLAGTVVLLLMASVLTQCVLLVRTRTRYEELFRQLAAVRHYNEDVWAMLTLIKGWTVSARTHSKEAHETAKEAKAVAPALERQVAEAVAAVPERTADLVVERIKDDSDPLKKVRGGP